MCVCMSGWVVTHIPPLQGPYFFLCVCVYVCMHKCLVCRSVCHFGMEDLGNFVDFLQINFSSGDLCMYVLLTDNTATNSKNYQVATLFYINVKL